MSFLSLAAGHAFDASCLASLAAPPTGKPDNDKTNNDAKKGSKHGESLGPLLKERRKSQENDREQEEHDANVDKGESTPDAGSLSKLASGSTWEPGA